MLWSKYTSMGVTVNVPRSMRDARETRLDLFNRHRIIELSSLEGELRAILTFNLAFNSERKAANEGEVVFPCNCQDI